MKEIGNKIINVLEKYALILIFISLFWSGQLILGEYYPQFLNVFFAIVNILGVVGLLIGYFKTSVRQKSEWFFPGDVVVVNDAAIDKPDQITEKYRWTVKAYNPNSREIHAMMDDGKAFTFEHYQVELVSRSRKLVELTRKQGESYKDPRYKHD